jgi:hypothetical protein
VISALLNLQSFWRSVFFETDIFCFEGKSTLVFV